MSQESFNIETFRKCHTDITDLKNKYHEKQRKYKNAYNKLLHASTGASSVGVISGISTIGTALYCYLVGCCPIYDLSGKGELILGEA